MKLKIFAGILGICALPVNSIAEIHTFYPAEDVCITTYAGGEGGNVFMKFDISDAPELDIVDSVFLVVFIWRSDSAWDGDVKFWNVNSQSWTEDTSITTIWAIPTSDSILQDADCGDTTGWTSSVDITPIFLKDYDAGNTYCSIKLKDPDDITTVPQSFGFPVPVNDADTLAVGNFDYIFFYPHEHLDSIPKLILYYTLIPVEGSGQISNYKLEVRQTSPVTTIRYQLPRKSNVSLKIYDICGMLVDDLLNTEQEQGTYEVNWAPRSITNGIYFINLKAGEHNLTEKFILLM